MSRISIFLCISMVAHVSACMRMIPPEEVGFSSTVTPTTEPETDAPTTVTATMTATVSETAASTTAMENLCTTCDFEDILIDLGGDKDVISGWSNSDPTAEGCVQAVARCTRDPMFCESIMLYAQTATETVPIGDENILVSQADFVCNTDGTWSSGSTDKIEVIYCMFVNCS